MKKLLFLLLLPLALYSQQPQSMSSAEILAAVKKLNVLGSVLYIAAHPDDENTRLITYLSREMNIRTAYLSLTRGDGGQNLVGKEQAEMLGLLRTQELLAARRIDGGEQYFTRANDFGYSKNPEETFRIWNKDSILSDVVWVIRNFKPDVIICRFSTNGDGGHGHHTASAMVAEEAFKAAADPQMFKSQLKFTGTWQAKKLFLNKFNVAANTTDPELIPVDVGKFNPLLGKSYGEIASESRSMHKSQGFGTLKTRGTMMEYFKPIKGDTAKKDLFAGIDMSWNRLKNGATIQKMINDCIHWYDPQSPEKSLTTLLGIYQIISGMDEKDEYTAYWRKQKMKELEIILMNTAGIWVEAFTATPSAIPGARFDFTTQIMKGTDADVKIGKVYWNNGVDTIVELALKKNELVSLKHFESLKTTAAYSSPFWLNKEHAEGLYNVTEQSFIGKTENSPAATIMVEVFLQGLKFNILRPIVFKSSDPVKGEVYRPFEILPPVTINFPSKSFAFRNGTNEKIQLEIKSNTDSTSGMFKILLPKDWTCNRDTIRYTLTKNETKFEEIIVTAPVKATDGFISAVSISDTVMKSIRRIEYDHVPFQFTLTDAKAKVVSFEIEPGISNIGYIPGAGDEVASSLKQLGYHVTILDEELLSKDDLSKYDAIVTGIRAYNTNEWMQNEYGRLMDYVKNGGNLVVQYNTNNRIGPVVAKISPYPFTISRERVTDENAEMRFVNPSHRILNYPNKISGDDFKNWKQERGIYFATEIDSAYEKIFSINDPGEKASEGSLLVCKYGKGTFVYTGLVFFRELPAGIPGAYRLFANLLSLGKEIKN